MRIRYVLVIAVGTAALVAWLVVVLVASSRKSLAKCPSCSSNRVRPSWPTIIDKVFSISAIRSFRCEACTRRFYARESLWRELAR
jgi:uncharacterized protein with PIN domain